MAGNLKEYEFQGEHGIAEVAKTEFCIMAAAKVLGHKGVFHAPTIFTHSIVDIFYEYNQSLAKDKKMLPDMFTMPDASDIKPDMYKLEFQAVAQKIACVSVGQTILLMFFQGGGIQKNFMAHIVPNSTGILAREVIRNVS